MTKDHNHFLFSMMASGKQVLPHWEHIKYYAENEFKSLLLTIEWIKQMKVQNKIDTEQARIHIDIQKATMRTRLMALPDISMLDAEHIINAAIDSIRKETYAETGWVIF